MDVDLAATATTAAGTITHINGVAQGTDVTDRIGRKFMMKSLLLRISCRPNSATTVVTGDIVRTLVVYDSQTNSALPNVTDVINFATWDSPQNLANRDRFKILFDKLWPMNPVVYAGASPTVGAPMVKATKVFRKFNLEVINSGTGATVASVATGGIFLITVGLINLGSTIDWYSRIRYTDA